MEARLKAEFKQQLESNEGYKGLQRAYAKTEQRFTQELQRKEALIEELRSSMSEGFDYLGKTVMSALPDDQREQIEKELTGKQLARLTNEVATLRRGPVQQAAPQADDAWEEQLNRLRQETKESLEETARDHGLEAGDKGLDYGLIDEPFPARLKKLNQSIKAVKKAREEADVDSVRQKSTVPPVRTNDNSGPTGVSGSSLIDRGMDEMWAKIKNTASSKKR